MAKKVTGLKTTDGKDIYHGSVISISYKLRGLIGKNGKFFGCFPGDTIKKITERHTMVYHVFEYSAGYFIPSPMGLCGRVGMNDKVIIKLIRK